MSFGIKRIKLRKTGLFLPAIDAVVSDIDTPDRFAFDIKDRSEIAGNFDGMNCRAVDRGQFVDLVRTQPGIERILFENLKRRGSCSPILGR